MNLDLKPERRILLDSPKWKPKVTMDSNDVMSTALGLGMEEASNEGHGGGDWKDTGSNDSQLNDTMLSNEDVERLIRENPNFRISTGNFDPVTQASLIAAFAVLIAFGTAGNSLVCYVVLANRHMRTPRNVLITNLAASDLVLCLFTQPFNLMKVSMTTWKLGTAVCKLIPMASGTNVFVSTISITAIALDRFHLIVHPMETDLLLMKSGASIALVFIWILSMLMATPMLVFSTTRSVEPIPGVKLYDVCVENPDHHYAKVAYSVASMIVQYLVPIAILSVAHAQICKKLRYRMATSRPTVTAATATATANTPIASEEAMLHNTTGTVLSPFQARKLQAERTRKRKTNLLLVMIAVVFASGWMPLNVVNVIADFDQTWILSFDKNGLVFAVCHLLVLSSACANPVLYGWLNDNFRQEFLRVLCGRFQRTRPQIEVGGGSAERGLRVRHSRRPCCCCWSPERATPKETLGMTRTSSPRTVASTLNHSVETTVHLKDLSVKVEPMNSCRSTDL